MHAVLYTDREFWNCVSIALITVSKTGVSVHFLCVLLLSMNFKIYWFFLLFFFEKQKKKYKEHDYSSYLQKCVLVAGFCAWLIFVYWLWLRYENMNSFLL